MTKRKYFFVPFKSTTMKSSLAYLSEHMLRRVDRINGFLSVYTDESYGQSPRWILHNMMQNNESVFRIVEPDIIPCASTSSQGQTSQKTSSPLTGESSSSWFIQNLPLEDRTEDASVPDSLETKNTDGQESDKHCEKSEIISGLSEGDKMDVSTVNKSEIDPEEHKAFSESSDEIKGLIERNLVQIKEVEVIKEHEFIGVEIDIDSCCTSEDSSPTKPEKDSSHVKKTNSPEKPVGKRKSPFSSPSKLSKSTDGLSVAREQLPTVNYSDPIILDFLAKRLLSILSYRSTCMKQIHNYFEKFLRDVQIFYDTIKNIKFVLDFIPMKNQPHNTDDLRKLRQDLINKVNQMLKQLKPFVEDLKSDLDLLKKCLEEIEGFENENASALSAKSESNRTFSDLKKIELRLKEICKDADHAVVFNDGRKAILSNSSSDFKWLVTHFVKFLIITGLLTILCPPYPGSPSTSKDIRFQ